MGLLRMDASVPKFLCFVCIFIFIIRTVAIQFPLTGSGWTLSLASVINDTNNWTMINVTVPGDVYLDLFNAKKIQDPYYRDNDIKLRWIGKQNWTYTKMFNLSEQLKSKRVLLLRADGLDTVAEIYFNNILIGQSSNMFREYLFTIPLTAIQVQSGHQNLTLKFFSPINYSLSKFREHVQKKNYSVGLKCRSSYEHGECHANFIRKTQASYGWDWGPAFPTMGVWKFLSLEAFDVCYLKRFSVVPSKKQSRWNLHTEFFLYCNAQAGTEIRFCVDMHEIDFRQCWTVKIFQKKLGPMTVYRLLPLPENATIDYWWPNGLGLQRLYRVVGEFRASEEKDNRELHVGFRRVQLIEEPVVAKNEQRGLTFFVKLNDVPIFLKGANWIPGDSFQTRLSENIDRLEFYFRSMREANMNCIRIWGGGVYESDRFYELADRYGITIWHDMMFAVNLYPSTDDFLDTVRSEIYDQINRLKYHASIIVWAGNNENEQGLMGNWYTPMDASFEVYKKDYMSLFNSTIYQAVNETDFFTRPYVLSSPSNGRQTWVDGGVSDRPNDNLYGDVHFYDYSGDSWSWKKYPTPRCVTEYGFMSMPSLETLKKVLLDEDLDYFGEQILNRQHHDTGEELISQLMSQFRLSSNCTERNFYSRNSADKSCHLKGKKKLEDLIYLSQIHQAMAYKTETEHYRRWRSMLNSRGEGLTMCALYWQLNDIWQAPTWSSIDYGRKWKASHYEAKRFFAHILVSPYVDDSENLNIVIINDLNREYANLTVVVRGVQWLNFRPVFEYNVTVEKIDPTSSSLVFNGLMSKFTVDQNLAVLDFVLLTSTGDQLGPNNVMLMQKLYSVPTDNFGLVYIDGVTMEGAKVFRIDLLASGVAPFVWLDVANVDGFFTDNSFTMVTKRRSVKFISWDRTSLAEISKGLSVKTLGDIYRTETKSNKDKVSKFIM